MSADANSAFEDHRELPSGSRWRTSDRDSRGFLHQPKTGGESSGESGPSRDKLPFGLPLSAAANVQAAPLPKTEWFETGSAAQSPASSFYARIQRQIRHTLSDQVTPVRLASHLSVLAVAAIVLVISQVNIPDWTVSWRLFPNSTMLGSENAVSGAVRTQVSGLVNRQGQAVFTSNESLQRATVPFTIVHEEPQQEDIEVYTVQPGDTVLGIAQKFGLQPETIQWSNGNLETNADLIRPGDRLNILPVDGVLHVVSPGDTLSSLASKYRVTMEDILNYQSNGLADPATPLVIGNQLVVPGGTKPFVTQQGVVYSGGSVPASARIGSGTFVWPSSGSINQSYWSGHRGVDVGAWTGAPVKAADGGYVAIASGGWNAGYGNHVIIDHGNGFVTLYAHLNSIFVRQGESVARGQQVGSVGNTGNSTGPHLHFEIRYQGVPRNPMGYLP